MNPFTRDFALCSDQSFVVFVTKPKLTAEEWFFNADSHKTLIYWGSVKLGRYIRSDLKYIPIDSSSTPFPPAYNMSPSVGFNSNVEGRPYADGVWNTTPPGFTDCLYNMLEVISILTSHRLYYRPKFPTQPLPDLSNQHSSTGIP